MRFSIITFFFLLFVSAALAAQSAPVPTAPEIISEDDLKLGIYDAPVFQPAVRNLTFRQTEGQAKGGELLFVLGPDSAAPRPFRGSPSFIRLHLACRQKSASDEALTVVLELLENRQVSQRAVATGY